MEKFYKLFFNKLFLLLIFASFNHLSAQTASTDDFDGDGIANYDDIDDDNDGILDIFECPNLGTAFLPSSAGSAWPGGTTSTITRFPASLPATITQRTASLARTYSKPGGGANFSGSYNGADYDINTSGAAVTLTYTFSTPIPADQLFVSMGDVDNNGGNTPQPYMQFVVNTSGGGTATASDFDFYKVGTAPWPGGTVAASTLGSSAVTNGLKFIFNVGTAGNDSRAIMLRGKTAKTISRLEITFLVHEQAFFNIGAFKYPTCDTDNDGVPNIFDLDSDGDGCPDAVEAGTAAQAGVANTSTGTLVNKAADGGTQVNIVRAIVGNKLPASYGANGFYTGIESDDTSAATYSGIYSYGLATAAALNACPDFDGDGTPDAIDIDDDNDGVPDAVESPSCFYLASEWNSGAKPSYGVSISSALMTTTSNFSQLIDGVSNTTAVAFSAAPTQAILNANVYVFTFLQPVKLDALYLQFNTATQFAGTTKLQGSNDAATWVDLSAAVSTVTTNTTVNGGVSVANSIKYPVTLSATTAYKYFRITGAVASNIAAANASEVYFDFNTAAYVSSRYPKATCTDANIDGDGILPQFDLDTDGDGCSDAFEASATTNLSTNYQFPDVDTNNDGLVDAVDSDGDGIVNYTTTYNLYAINKIIKACVDTDGDGIRDIIDIDDDNDGVLDIVEMGTCTSVLTGLVDGSFEAAASVAWNENTNTGSLNSTMGATGWTSIGSPDTWTGGFSLVGSGYWGGAMNGVPPTLDGNVFAAIYNGFINEGITKSIPASQGIKVGHTYTVEFYQIFGGVNGITPVDRQAQLRFTFDGVSYLSNTMTYNGNNPKQWEKTSITYTATTNAPVLTIDVLSTGDGNYIGIDGIVFYEQNTQGCGDVPLDTDGDGIPNYLDLDSDGDGCPDAKESGVSVNSGASSSMSTSGGAIYTGGIASGTANAYVGNGTPSQYGANGFFNGIEATPPATESGVYNGTYTYNQYALIKGLNFCTDTDNDGIIDIVDIDDDNDGVLDAVESPTCFYTANEWNTGAKPAYGVTISSALTTTTSNFSQLIDGIGSTTAVAFSGTPTQAIQNTNVYLFNFAQPVRLDALYLQFNTTTQFLGTTKIQGSNTNNGSDWADLSASTGPAVTTNTTVNGGTSITTSIKYPVTLNTGTSYKYIRITGDAASNIAAQNASEVYFDFNTTMYTASQYPKSTCTEDIDNDGILNHLDLDSDGDGCPDTKEAILYNNPTEASASGNVQNGSSGAVTSTVSTPNATVPGPYGSNGFADALELSTNPNAYKHVYSYLFVATDRNISTCDNKFLMDIDSDDDGIPDAVESPSCFYTESQAMIITDVVTSDFAWDATNKLTNTYDNNSATYGAVSAATTSILNKALITFDIPVIDAALMANVKLSVGATTFGAGTWVLEGLDTTTTLWVPLSSPAQAMNTANFTFTFTNSLQPNVRYHTYRIRGTSSTNITNGGILTDFSINYFNYNPSLHRTKTGCNSDVDGDGVPNYLDRDSDGDGCPDAVEAGISKSLLVPANFFNTGGQVSGNYVIVGGAYGNNGMGDAVETTPDSGIINYVSTYNLYARSASLNWCTDTDNDGVPDPADIDDDNDGVLDAIESPSCFYTAAEANVIFRINSQFTSPNDDQTDNDIQLLHDGSATATFGFNAVAAALNVTGSNLFTVIYPTPIRLATLVVSQKISTTTNANAIVVGSQDGLTWSAPLTSPTLITGATVSFAITTTVPYNYYKIQTGSVPGALALANTIGEITSTLASDYSQSAHPKPTCTNDTDGDGILNHQDLDSDGDGCTDASESGTVAYALAQTGGQTSSGTVVNLGATTTGVINAIVGNNTPSDYSANGFYNKIESMDILI